jgi:hypothetical protein
MKTGFVIGHDANFLALSKSEFGEGEREGEGEGEGAMTFDIQSAVSSI